MARTPHGEGSRPPEEHPETNHDQEFNPVRTMMHARVSNLESDLVRLGGYGKFTMKQENLQKILVPMGDGESVSAIRKALASLSVPKEQDERENFFRDLPANLERFMDDLPYLELFEQGGLEAVNRELGERLMKLRAFENGIPWKQPENDEERARAREFYAACESLNDLLVRAIYLFPHAAQGVEVTLKKDLLKRDGADAEKFAMRFGSDSGRYQYLALKKAYAKPNGLELPDAVTVPLPYWYTTDTHGSGERAARGASSQDVRFAATQEDDPHAKSDVRREVPVLQLSLEKPLVTQHYASFGLDEIKDVRLVEMKTAEFTPWVDDKKLVPRPDAVTHYLNFRDFVSYRGWKKPASVTSLSDDEWRKQGWDVLQPSMQSRSLWANDYNRSMLKKGFMVRKSPDLPESTESSKPMMWEFTNVPIPKEVEHDEFAAAILLSKQAEDPKWMKQMKVQTWMSHEIISRLAAIPPDPRIF